MMLACLWPSLLSRNAKADISTFDYPLMVKLQYKKVELNADDPLGNVAERVECCPPARSLSLGRSKAQKNITGIASVTQVAQAAKAYAPPWCQARRKLHVDAAPPNFEPLYRASLQLLSRQSHFKLDISLHLIYAMTIGDHQEVYVPIYHGGVNKMSDFGKADACARAPTRRHSKSNLLAPQHEALYATSLQSSRGDRRRQDERGSFHDIISF